MLKMTSGIILASSAYLLLGIPDSEAANFQAANDRSYTFQLKNTTNVAWPAGTNLVATSGLPNSLGVSIGGNSSATTLTITPKVQNSPAIPITITGNGAVSQTFLVDIIPDPIPPLVISVDQTPANVTNILQPVPTNPGP